jgi:lysophospholipase L1-like esterase
MESFMMKRLGLLLAAITLLLAAAPVAQTVALGITVVTKCPPPALKFDAIQSGLWAGVNLDPDGIWTSTGTKVIVTENGTFCSTPNDIANPPIPDFNQSVAAVENANNSTNSNTSGSSTSTSTNSSSSTSTTNTSSPTVTMPTTASSTGGAYVAMGDSIAAGVGLPNPMPSNTGQSNCGVTAEAYPFLVAANHNMPVRNVACSGATVSSMYKAPTGPFGNASQMSLAFASGTPKIITITAGANDAQWSQLASNCFFGNCATTAQTTKADADLVTLQKNFMGLLAAIQSKSGNNPPQVIVTGYYNPISTACTTMTSNITPDEVNWMTGEVNALNQTIQGVVDANSSFAQFVSVDFSGHDICSSDSWVQGLTSPRPFHPTALGQQVIAGDIESAL